ncbi:MAG: GGDEF domain-containing protein [Candidatus Woesearchaeota archaeon]
MGDTMGDAKGSSADYVDIEQHSDGGITIVIDGYHKTRIANPEDARLILTGQRNVDSFKTSEDKKQLNVSIVDYLVSSSQEIKRQHSELQSKHLAVMQGLDDKLRESNGFRDSLTGLYSRQYFDETLDRELSRAQRYQSPLAVVMLGISNLDQLIERHGQISGNDVLRKMGEVLKGLARKSDLPARYDANSFAILLPETTAREASDVSSRMYRDFSMKMRSIIPDWIKYRAMSHAVQMYEGDSAEVLMKRATSYKLKAK